MIRNLINQKGRWASNFAVHVSKCLYSNPVSLSQRNLDFDLDLKLGDEEFFKRKKIETKPINVTSVAEKMKSCFGCSGTEAVDFVKKHEEKTSLKKLGQCLDLLSSKGIKLQTIMRHQWLVYQLQPARLKLSLSVIESMEPTRLDDLIPLARIPPVELIKIQHKLLAEKSKFPDANRVYYLSRLLEIEPIFVADCFGRLPALFNKKIERLAEAVKVLQDFNIESKDIIKSPRIFTKTPQDIQKKLKVWKTTGSTDFVPVYLMIPENRLKARVENKKRGSERKSILEVLSERLGSPDIVRAGLKSYTRLPLLTPKNINEKLDYLLIEAGISPANILNYLCILNLSKELVRKRLEQLKSIGYPNPSMTLVAKSQQFFDKHVKNLEKEKKT